MDEAPPASPPLPKRGAYSIDFDSLDENTNPFATKSKIGLSSSPPIRSEVSQTENEDPFKPRKVMANSPPGSPKVSSPINRTTISIDSEEVNNSSQSAFDEGILSNNALMENTNNDKSPSQTIPKKKKIAKKSNLQSKFKPPKKFTKQEDNEDIQIFMPGVDTENNNKISKPNEDLEKNVGSQSEIPLGQEEEGDPPLDAAPEAMASSWEADHRFVEGDEGDDELLKEDFASPLEERRVRPSQDSAEHQRKSSDNAFLNQTPPAQPESPEDSRAKHPAVRALETAQAESGASPGKFEASSDENKFYDAYDFVPPASSQTSSGGQAIPTTMDKASQDGTADQNKGTVVQLVQVLRYSQSDWNKMKQELELNYQTSLLNKERDWSHLLADRDKKISSLTDTSKKLKATNEDMRMVVAEFEKTISQLQADKEKSKSESHKTVNDLEQERDQALEDLQSVETAFSDLHRRYEKSKSIIEGFKRNEEQLKNCVEDIQGKLKKSEAKLQTLRSHAEEKLDRANEDMEKIKKSTRSEVVRLEAALKKAELRISSLEESLQRKEKENQELTAICDELIAKVGS